ncbi:MAG: hypothetical protein Aureis2KO_03560 [Aureisphaera sp.]
MKYVFSFLGFMLVAVMFGQQAQRTSMGMSGGTYTVENGESRIYVSQSVGQEGIIGSFQGSEYGVRQGFQQPPIRIVSISQNDNALDAVVYPNPVATVVTVKFNEAVLGSIQGKLFDVSGKEVFYKEYDPMQTLTIDLSHLPVGTYILVVGTQGKQFTSRLIKN